MILRQLWEHDLAWSFRRSPVTIVAAALTVICVAAALAAPWVSPQDPFDMAALNLSDAFTPPAWDDKGMARYPLGTDNQGRDILSTIMHGARISLGVGIAAVLFAVVLGVSLGLLSGYLGGRVDAVIMRIADVQLSFPAILIALLIDGVARVALPGDRHDDLAIPVLVLAIGFAGWVQYARTVRAYCTHPEIPIAKIRTNCAIFSNAALGSATRTMPLISSAIRIAGKESCTSAMRMIRASSRPPTYPETRPSVTPSTIANSTAVMPTASEMRAP